MKIIYTLLFLLISSGYLKAQLYINSDITIQNGATVYVDDTVQLASSAVVNTNGVLQSTKTINTNGNVINTGTTGYIVALVASGVSKSFDIGTTSNNKIQIQHTTGSNVVFQLAVRDNVYLNPQTSTTQLTTNVVNKTWVIIPQSSVVNLSGIAYWNASDEASGFLRSNCGVSYWQNGSSTSWTYTNGTSAATTTGSSPAYSKATSAAGLTAGTYYFGVGGLGSSLPVTLLKFDATKNTNEDVLLNWITSTEINNDHFDLERSVDGSQFTVFANVKGAGNSSRELTYLYKDITPFAKLNATTLYYRLKQVDVDGKYQYSEIREVAMQKGNINNTQITMYPNPNNGLLTIEFQNSTPQELTIHVIDANGKNIIHQKLATEAGKQKLLLNTSELSAGVYMLSVSDQNNLTISQQKLVIIN